MHEHFLNKKAAQKFPNLRYYDVVDTTPLYTEAAYKNVAHLSLLQWCCLGNRLCIPPWGVLFHIGVSVWVLGILSSHHHSQ